MAENKRVRARWVEGFHFEAETGTGFRVAIDGPGEAPRGPRPKEYLLVALCGCTGMDVASILQKMRVPVTSLEVQAEGEEAPDHPKRLTAIQVVYRVAAPEADRDKVLRAVQLSWDKYCGVTHTLNKAARMTYGVELNGQVVAEGG